MYAGIGITSRVTELPNSDSINYGAPNDLENLGLYIYYKSDYDEDDLSQPYIRNMECRVEDGKVVPILADGESASNKDIYIYDNMTIVVFYPYNPDAPDFSKQIDEEQYPITRNDYSQQTYIPYRGDAEANPTNAYYIELVLYPKHTFKIEIILVSDDRADFNENNPDIKVLPNMDPVDNTDPTGGKRERWYDLVTTQPNTGGGSNVIRYTAYLWRVDDRNNMIYRNDVLFENGDFTLLASEDVNIREQRVYRYGYNLSNGEIFIPTSSYLINDAKSLQNFRGIDNTAYQVCDIDLSVLGGFTPLSLLDSRYDGGGHKITNLTINSSDTQVGLFSKVIGNSVLKDINLIDPVINVNSTDTCYVGALCGQLNYRLTDADLQLIYNSITFPEELSEVVKEALLQDLLSSYLNSQAQMMGCRVENPTITVSSKTPRVGTVCGANGDLDGSNSFKGLIWDTYNLGGTLSVNAGNESANQDGRIGGFCGLNEFFIGRSYTTITADDITAQIPQQGSDENGNPITVYVDSYQGFANQGTLFTAGEGAGISSAYAAAPDTNSGVSQLSDSWPPSGEWIKYTGIWPINTLGWTDYSSNSYWYSVGSPGTSYPILQWERR